MYDVLTIFFGGWILDGLGFLIRKVQYFFLNVFAISSLKRRFYSKKRVRFRDNQNRITGLAAILILVFAFSILQSLRIV